MNIWHGYLVNDKTFLDKQDFYVYVLYMFVVGLDYNIKK